MNTFLPKGYKAPAGSSSFMKLEEGANRFRIMTDAVIGWEGWIDSKPFRREGIDKNINDDEVDVDPKYKKPKINHFWAFKVWDYTDNAPKLLEITQKTIMKSIQGLVDDPDWGDPKEYDLSITKVKEGDRTTYSVKAYPPKPVTPEILEACENSEIDPKSLFKETDDMQDYKAVSKKSKK